MLYDRPTSKRNYHCTHTHTHARAHNNNHALILLFFYQKFNVSKKRYDKLALPALPIF